MKSLLEVLKASVDYLSKKKVAYPRRSAERILQEALKISKTDLYLQFDRPLSEEELATIRPLLQRRGKGEPVEYILGEIPFADLVLKITDDVLIPRQESEILVEKVAHQLEKDGGLEGKILWDLCTGSGALGLSIKKRFPMLQITLSDLSAKALDVAKENAKRNQLSVSFRCGDFLQPFAGEKAHYILCNPPYISKNEYEGLSYEVKDFEPMLALVGGEDGFYYYRLLAQEISNVLLPDGKCFLEIGHQQGGQVKQIFQDFSGRIEKDWSGLDRFFFLEME